MKVLICDDIAERGNEIVDAISDARPEGADLDELFFGDLKNALNALFSNVAAFFDDDKDFNSLEPTAFDTADIVILDNNLTHLGIEGTRLTAEAVAGYIRAFTAAPYVISLNKNPYVDFDLRYLFGDYSTQADMALNTGHLSNLALWTGKKEDAKAGFLPWYWPKLLNVADARRKQIQFVRERLDEPVLAAFFFPPEATAVLSRHGKGTLSPTAEWDQTGANDGKPIEEITFRDFFSSSNRSLPTNEEREKLIELEAADKDRITEVIARVVASEIDHWFRRDVLGAQEVLVDVPHLLMRMPFILGERAKDMAAWKQAVTETSPPFGLDPTLFDEFIAPCVFSGDVWVSRPVFWWPALSDNDELNKRFSISGTWADVVFCEDTSDFEDREAAGGESPKEFVTELEGPWERRHIQYLDGFKYAPRSRLAS